MKATIDVVLIGTGEYTTGYVHGAASGSDKSAGVVGLTMFDLRRRGFIDRIAMAGTNGTKFAGIRNHLQSKIADTYSGMDIGFNSYPDDTVASDPLAYKQALDSTKRGDVVVIFTPDATHFQIAMDAVACGCHVLIAKPIVKKLEQHILLRDAAKEQQRLVAMEVHKRWDPIYADARDRIRGLGDFSFFQSYMSQPKSQLETFQSWAGKSSDISYYLNAHHIDFHAWSMAGLAIPKTVRASAATGLAKGMGIDTEDTITLSVDWENIASGNVGTAIYTASWIAPKSDVHSQQRFFYMGHQGEVTVDQAHRGYSIADDANGFSSANPLFMKYAPDAEGKFAGQLGYGYRSIEDFVLAAIKINGDISDATNIDNADEHNPPTLKRHGNQRLASVDETLCVTGILEAGRRSLDDGGRAVTLVYDEQRNLIGLD